MLTIKDLPESADGLMLYCHRCHGSYSATKGDYFWMPPTKAFRCEVCRTPLVLVRESTRIEVVKE